MEKKKYFFNDTLHREQQEITLDIRLNQNIKFLQEIDPANTRCANSCKCSLKIRAQRQRARSHTRLTFH